MYAQKVKVLMSFLRHGGLFAMQGWTLPIEESQIIGMDGSNKLFPRESGRTDSTRGHPGGTDYPANAGT